MKYHFRVDVEIETGRPLDTADIENALGAGQVMSLGLEEGDTARVGAIYLEHTPDGASRVFRAAQAISDTLLILEDAERRDVLEWALTRVAAIVDEKAGIVHKAHGFEGVTQACARCGRGKRDALHLTPEKP